MSKKFDLVAVLQSAGPDVQSGHAPAQIVLIPLDRIVPDPLNFYSLDGIDELAANIETVGLLDALRVRPFNGDYMIVSGHRRRAACMMIRDGGNPMFDAGVPCIVEYGEASAAMWELRLIYANSSTRVMSAADLSKQAERTNAVLLELRKSGFEFKGRTRELVAQLMHTSESKLARVGAIRKNLTQPMLDMFDSGRLNESVAYRISQEPPEMQARIWKDQGSVLHNLTADGISAYLAHVRFVDSHEPEKNRVAEGVTPYRAEAEVSDYLTARKAEDADYMDMMVSRMDDVIDLLPLIDSRQDGIAAMKKSMRWGSTGGYTVNYEGRGNGFELESRRRGIEPILRSWTEAYDVLCCCALNRLGKMNASRRPSVPSAPPTAPAWSSGNPREPGWYACWAAWCDKYRGAEPYDPDYETLYWTGSLWTNGLHRSDDAGFAVYGWVALPAPMEKETVSDE